MLHEDQPPLWLYETDYIPKIMGYLFDIGPRILCSSLIQYSLWREGIRDLITRSLEVPSSTTMLLRLLISERIGQGQFDYEHPSSIPRLITSVRFKDNVLCKSCTCLCVQELIAIF